MTDLLCSGEPWRLLDVLSGVDLVLLVAVTVGLFVGYRTGFVWQLAAIIGVVACVWVTGMYSPVVSEFADRWVPQPFCTIGSVVVTLLAALAICSMAAFLLRSVINAVRLERPDRAMGAALGALNVLVIAGLVGFAAMIFTSEDSSVRQQLDESRAASAMGACVRRIVPEDVREQLKQRADQI